MRYRYLRFPGGKGKAVTFSYDDGCRADIRFSTLLSDHHLKGTFNINSDFIAQSDGSWHLTKEEIQKYLLDRGHEIAVHGAEHKANGVIRPVEGIRDVLRCRKGLEDAFGIIVRGMAYPDSGIRRFHNGTTLSQVEVYLHDLDIVYARTLGGDNNRFDLPEDWLTWMPTAYHKNPGLFAMLDEFLSLTVKEPPKLFYLWGHAYEFDKDDNWNIIEEFCEKVAGRDDIWYATNMEIYEYVQAYHSLIFSVDSLTMYNPTLKKLWFNIDGQEYSVEPGETLKIG